MKKLLYSLFIIFSISCDVISKNQDDLKLEVDNKVPIDIFIDESDNGILVFKNKILRIKSLKIEDEIQLKDDSIIKNKYYPILNAFYNVDNNGSGLLFYSRNTHYNTIGHENSDTSIPSYIIEIEKNEFNINTIKKNLEEPISKIFNIINYSKNNYDIYFETSSKDNNIKHYLGIKKVRNNIMESYYIGKPEIKNISDKFNFYLDEKGNGWYSDNNLTEKYSIVSNYSLEKEVPINLKAFLVSAYLDEKGNGFILRVNNEGESNFSLKKYYLSEFKENNKVDNILNLSNKYSFSNEFIKKNLKSNGNGAMLFQVEDNKKINSYSILMKVMKNFQEQKEVFISKEISPNCNFSINSKGNGFIIISNKYINEYKIKKIINYEIQK